MLFVFVVDARRAVEIAYDVRGSLPRLIIAAVLLMMWAPWRTTPDPARLTFELPMVSPSGTGNSLSMFAISPDGTQVVAQVRDGDVQRLAVRTLARLEAVTLARTDGAAFPFWSPDGRAVGFFAGGS